MLPCPLLHRFFFLFRCFEDVEIAKLNTFKRMKKYEVDVAFIAAALENSETVELDDTKTKMKRKVPLAEDAQEQLDLRSIYAVGGSSHEP